MLKEIKKINPPVIGQLELLCEVNLEEMAPYLNRAAKRISQRIKIPGFRSDKVPYEMIKREVGEMDIYHEALDEIISQDYFKTAKKEKLKIIGPPKIDIQTLVPGQPIVYKAIVDVLPKVKLPDYKNIKIKKPEIIIKPKQIDESLKHLQKSKAKEILIKREAKKGDKTNINIEMFENKIPIEDGQIKNHSIIIGEPYFIPGFSENLIGLKEGAIKEFELKMPKDYYNKNLANRIVNFKIKINSIYQIDIPELNDEFAKNFGEFKTLEDLTKQLEENVKNEEALKIDEKLENELMEQIINQSSFEDISDKLTDLEIDKMFSELELEILRNGMKIEDYLSHIKITEQDLKKNFHPLAIKRVKAILVIQKIAEQETIEISESEIIDEINTLLKLYSIDKNIQNQIQTQDFKKHIEGELINKKTLNFLKQTCIIQ